MLQIQLVKTPGSCTILQSLRKVFKLWRHTSVLHMQDKSSHHVTLLCLHIYQHAT